MIKKIKENLQTFFIIWLILIVLNQIFIFGACFAPYCLIAALPHTGVIAGLIVFFMNKEESNSYNKTSLSPEFKERNEEVNKLVKTIEKNKF